MDVGDLVGKLAASFARSLQLYAQWRRLRLQQNHYHKPEAKTMAAGAASALATSLGMGARVQEVYMVGLALLGAEYARGDAAGLRALAAQCRLLDDQVALLRAALAAAAAGTLDINVILQASETARMMAIQALVDQHQRMARSRPGLPCDLPLPKWRSPSRGTLETKAKAEAEAETETPVTQLRPPPQRPPLPPPPPPLPPPPPAPSTRWLVPPDDDTMTTAWSVLSGPLVFQSEPPSPPPTPKPRPVSASSAPSTPASVTMTSSRPANSVFHIFCPHALALQADVRRPVPAASRRCRCGARYVDDTVSAPLKDGFRLSRRFLAKSHCEGRAAGYGCVLCTSSGRAPTFATASALRAHIDASHDKWQMLHDRDMA